jgi:hypothetical protein
MEEKYKFEIDANNLTQEFCEVPAMVAYYCEQVASARKERDLAKITRERIESHVYTLRKAESGKATVADLSALVAMDDAVQAAKMAEVEAEYAYQLQQSNAKAAEAKKDALQSLGAHLRADMKLSGINRNGIGDYYS